MATSCSTTACDWGLSAPPAAARSGALSVPFWLLLLLLLPSLLLPFALPPSLWLLLMRLKSSRIEEIYTL